MYVLYFLVVVELQTQAQAHSRSFAFRDNNTCHLPHSPATLLLLLCIVPKAVFRANPVVVVVALLLFCRLPSHNMLLLRRSFRCPQLLPHKLIPRKNKQ